MLLSGNALAEDYVISIGAEADSDDGRLLSFLGDFKVGKKTWLSMNAGLAKTDGVVRDNETKFGGVDVDFFFDPVGLRIGGAYWGDPDVLDSRDLKASLYVRGDAGSLSLEYENRNFEFDLQSDLLLGRTVKFNADGWGLSTRIQVGDRVSIFANGMVYEYSRPLRLEPDIDVLAFIARSRLSIIGSLIDNRYNAGLEFEFGSRSIDVSAGQWKTAIDGSTVDSYSIGLLTPVSDRVDAEVRVSFDDSEIFGRTSALSLYLYFFGGS